ncbi:hypothetical protein K9L67_05890 [Candidatus Woesearchaeota archaeon]|nr:hypothetical protein [Candidatus Woesearchaeota archaeon]MCF7901725.1 hypothetical protein [Candidatus Woesearchaeota archaeon]MCF8014079.1 hypothetical protein [Candidatus Woesearchaeota archaeon]
MNDAEISDAKELRYKIDSVTKRYNELVKEVTRVTEEHDMRELKIKDLDSNIKSEIEKFKILFKEIKQNSEKTESQKKILSKEFKNIIKKEQMKKLERQADRFKFEEYVSKDELQRKLGND